MHHPMTPAPGCASRHCRTVPGSEDGLQGHSRDAGSALCRDCTDRVRRDLVSLPELYDECGDQLIPVRRGWVREKVTGSRSRTIPFDTVAADARSEIMEILASWSGLVVSERRVRSPRRNPAALASFLLRHLDWLTAHIAAADFAEEVSKTADAARGSIEAHRSAGFELGPCVHPDCNSTIHASIRESGSQVISQIRCLAGHTWKTHEWLLLAHQTQISAGN